MIRNELEPLDQLGIESQNFLKQINNTTAVSVHVRRVDYVANAGAAAYHGTCDTAYYRESIEYVVQRVSNPTFFIFSDDPEWVKSEFKFEFPIVPVIHNRQVAAYEDMMLMSRCAHNIIANSSYSWWGAWLNRNPDKVVVCPKRWFKIGKDTKDLYLENWAII